jgi:hypothetical protein
MRLIHTKTYKLVEFFGESIPFFAILSHRWEAEEVTYLDLRDGLDGRVAQMKGWYKIRGCCAEASRNGFDYAVCIHSPFSRFLRISRRETTSADER